MFNKEVYINRREKLRKSIRSGLVLLVGNQESPMNYPHNGYRFRQDSNFLYFFGLNFPDLIAVIDIDNNKDYVFGNDLDIDDIIWTGPQPSIAKRSAEVGISNTAPAYKANELLSEAIETGRKIHFLPPYRGSRKLQLSELLGISTGKLSSYVSMELIKEIVKVRSIKEDCEVAEIERIFDAVTYDMHVSVMKMAANADLNERDLYGTMEGIALKGGGAISFPIILTIHGETLHNHYHGNKLEKGRLLLTDAGSESEMGYATDVSRTVPVGGKFTDKQKAIYNIVLKAETETIKSIRPNVVYKELHLNAAKIIVDGLKEIGLMKGDTEKAVEQGAHTMFYPHGIGHQMGLDVHDMEDLGEDNVGYDEEIQRSAEFGTAYLRLGRRLQKGFVITVEPGIYFIPELIKRWKNENKHAEFINYNKVDEYLDFGGIRIEDDILVTETGSRVLGKPIPKTIEEIEAVMNA